MEELLNENIELKMALEKICKLVEDHCDEGFLGEREMYKDLSNARRVLNKYKLKFCINL